METKMFQYVMLEWSVIEDIIGFHIYLIIREEQSI